MTTPSTVRPERILFVRRVSSAMRRTSPNSPLFTSERLDRVERRRARGRVRAEEQADGGAVMPTPRRIDQSSSVAGSGVTAARSIANVNPRRMPTRPPNVDSVIDSVAPAT